MDSSCVEQNPLGQRSLTGVNVCGDPDVAELFHGLLPPRLLVVLGSRGAPGGEVAEVEGAGEERGGGGGRWSGGDGERVEKTRCG